MSRYLSETQRVKVGDVFYAPKDSSEFTVSKDDEPRKYKAIEKYEHFMLCVSMNGMKHHKRCFSWDVLRRARVV